MAHAPDARRGIERRREIAVAVVRREHHPAVRCLHAGDERRKAGVAACEPRLLTQRVADATRRAVLVEPHERPVADIGARPVDQSIGERGIDDVGDAADGFAGPKIGHDRRPGRTHSDAVRTSLLAAE